AAILIEKTSGAAKEMTEADELKMLQKMAKQRRDSLEIFKTQNRPDLAVKEEEELAILSKFLPQQMSEEDLRKAIKEIIAKTGASSPADMGKVMGATNKALAGKADGKTISAIVKELLA
ncbi:MAG: GatB/YqeY domain-containing protein, partial [Chitinophagaceae bacterium]